MRKLNQKGIAHHLVLIIVGVVVVLVSALAGLRIYNGQKSAKAAGCASSVRLAPTVTNGTCVPWMLKLVNYGLSGTATSPIPNPVVITTYDATKLYNGKTLKQYVIDFQAKKGLIKDGIVGTVQTWPALCNLKITDTEYVTTKKYAGCELTTSDVATQSGWAQVGVLNLKGGFTGSNYGNVYYYACRNTVTASRVKLRVKNMASINADVTASWSNLGTSSASWSSANISKSGGIAESEYKDLLTGQIVLRAKSNIWQYQADSKATVSIDSKSLPNCSVN